MARKMLPASSFRRDPRTADPKEQRELAQVLASLDGDYGKGKWCPGGDRSQCLDVTAVGKLMATSAMPRNLNARGWDGIRLARRCGSVTREWWNWETRDRGSWVLRMPARCGRSNYDMPPDQLAKEADRLWDQLRPLYESLHAYVRGQLRKKYGNEIVPAHGPIPAHLLGNIWSQEWNNGLSADGFAKAGAKYDLTEDPAGSEKQMRKGWRVTEKRFFTSLGFAPCRKRFGKGHFSRNLRIATSFAMPALGTSIRKTTCESRCASRSRKRISGPFITNLAITFISARTMRSRRFPKQRK